MMRQRNILTLILSMVLGLYIESIGQDSTLLKTIRDTNTTEIIEHELIVMDLGYESFLSTKTPMEFYSIEYYRTWNQQYVIEWNIRARNNGLATGFEIEINYDTFEEYDLELEYRLYNYFLYFEYKYGIILIQRR